MGKRFYLFEMVDLWMNVFDSPGTRTAGENAASHLEKDAVYPYTEVDCEGQKLSGANKYTLTFPKGQTPPVDGFWSITMYEIDQGWWFVPNPLNKFTVSPRNNLKSNPDGSTTLYFQNESPGKDKEVSLQKAPCRRRRAGERARWGVLSAFAEKSLHIGYLPSYRLSAGRRVDARVPGLLAVDPPDVAVAHRGGFHVCRIGAVLGLGDAGGETDGPVEEAVQEPANDQPATSLPRASSSSRRGANRSVRTGPRMHVQRLRIVAVLLPDGSPHVEFVADDRSLDQQAVDLGLKGDIEQALLRDAPDLAAKVSVDVYLQRIMLTGVVPDASARWNAVRIARQATGDRMPYDDLEVVAGNTLVDSAEDAAINKTLGLNLLGSGRAGIPELPASRRQRDGLHHGPGASAEPDRDRPHRGAADAGRAACCHAHPAHG